MISKAKFEFASDRTARAEIAAMTILGDREQQEDCFGYELDEEKILLCLCDGMGGSEGGNIASRMAVEEILSGFDTIKNKEDIRPVLASLSKEADRKIFNLKNDNGAKKGAGTTLVACVLQEHELYWNAVGDSRLYIYRKGHFKQITLDQNYNTVLEEQLKAGVIDEDQYAKGKKEGAKLVSYVGIGNLSFIDYSKAPLCVKENDYLLICSDGLYKVLSDEEIAAIIAADEEIQTIVRNMEREAGFAAAKKHIKRDNMTVILVRIK